MANPVDKTADPNGARTVDAAADIGARLAQHRARRGIRVSALAREVGVSPSLISQIERGQSRPSVSTLFALAEALEVPVDAFFRDGDAPAPPSRPADEEPAPSGTAAWASGRRGRPDRYLVRRDERATLDIEGGVRWERLTPDALADLEFMELEYAPGAESNPTPYRHPGMEMLLVLAGRLEISVGFDRYKLCPGDSICFPSTLPHRYVNPGDVVARAVTVIQPDETPPGPANQRRT
jgi:transcriptional regulator with XRE-family HTH domain